MKNGATTSPFTFIKASFSVPREKAHLFTNLPKEQMRGHTVLSCVDL